MTRRRKRWFVAVSFLYVVVFGIAGGVSVAGCVHFLRHGPWNDKIPAGTLEQGLGTLASAILIGAVQIGRVLRSLKKTQDREQKLVEWQDWPWRELPALKEPNEPAFWLGPRGFGLYVMFLPALLGWLIALVIHA